MYLFIDTNHWICKNPDSGQMKPNHDTVDGDKNLLFGKWLIQFTHDEGH